MAIQAEIEDVREVLQRAATFKKQMSGNGPFHLMILPESRNLNEGCISCGTVIPEFKIRCPLCQAAAWIALEMKLPIDIRPEEEKQ